MSGITHEWNGTILTITSDSGTSSCDLKGDKGDDGCRGAQGYPGKDGKDGAGSSTELDTTLTKEGASADAKAVGDAIKVVDDKVGAIKVPVKSVNSKTGAVVLSASDVGALGLTGGEITGNLEIKATKAGVDLVNGNYIGKVFQNGTYGVYIQDIQDASSEAKTTFNVKHTSTLDKRIRLLDVRSTNDYDVYYVIHTGNINDWLPQTHYSTTQPTNWKNGDIWLKPAT